MSHATGSTARRGRGAFLARLLVWALAAGLLSQAAGCRPNKRYDLLEAEIRTREHELANTRLQLEQAQNLNRAYAQQSPNAAPPSPHAPAYIPVKEIALARGTGGVNDDSVPGDEGLMVVVVPKDEDGAAVKVPARLDIAAWEITPAGMKNPIGNWSVPAEKVRPTWRSGFISTGYFVAVPWQTYPSQERVRVAVRLTTLDGRAFETDRDIFVKLCQAPRIGPAGLPSTPVPPRAPGREPLLPDALPPGVEELPPPIPITPAGERGAKLLPPEKN